MKAAGRWLREMSVNEASAFKIPWMRNAAKPRKQRRKAGLLMIECT
jgi:hypothetical protein